MMTGQVESEAMPREEMFASVMPFSEETDELYSSDLEATNRTEL